MTQVLDREQIVEWAAQQPQRPWTKKPARLQAWIAVAALVPAVLVALIFMYTEIPGPFCSWRSTHSNPGGRNCCGCNKADRERPIR